jgi:hypothetical protein
MEPVVPPAATDEKDVIIDVHSALNKAAESSMVPHGTIMSKPVLAKKNARGATQHKSKKTMQGMRRVGEARNGLPTLRANPTMGYIFRYRSSGDIAEDQAQQVKISDIARSMVAAVDGDSYRYLFRAVRLNKVTIRSAPGSIGGSASVGIQFRGENTNEVTIMDQSTRVDHNAIVSRTPPRLSLASFWHDITNTTDDEKVLFSIFTNSSGTGISYVDMHVSVVFDEYRYINYIIQNNSLSGLNAGGLYYGNLSQEGGSGNKFTPVARAKLGL